MFQMILFNVSSHLTCLTRKIKFRHEGGNIFEEAFVCKGHCQLYSEVPMWLSYSRFSITKHGDFYDGSFYLLVDGQRFAFIEAHNSNNTPSGSATINLQLTAGQVVQVENSGSNYVQGTSSEGFIESWFTGHLLYALWCVLVWRSSNRQATVKWNVACEKEK